MEDSFGAYLKNQRELRGVSLEDIANARRITLKHLEALEEDRYDDLPAEVFIKGYIRGYGEVLETDVNDLLTAYDERIGKMRRQEREQSWNEAARQEQKKSSIQTQLKLVGLLVAVAAVGWGLWSTFTAPPGNDTQQEAHVPVVETPQPPQPFELQEFNSDSAHEPGQAPGGQQMPSSGPGVESEGQEIPAEAGMEETGSGTQETSGEPKDTTPPKKKQVAAKPGTGTSSGPPSANTGENKISQSENDVIINDLQDQTVRANRGASDPPESENGNTFSLEIRASEKAWFHMIVDREDEKDFTLQAGERIVLHAKDQILADIGNRQGSEFLLNGKKYELPGTHNVILNFVFKPDLVE